MSKDALAVQQKKKPSTAEAVRQPPKYQGEWCKIGPAATSDFGRFELCKNYGATRAVVVLLDENRMTAIKQDTKLACKAQSDLPQVDHYREAWIVHYNCEVYTGSMILREGVPATFRFTRSTEKGRPTGEQILTVERVEPVAARPRRLLD